MRRLVVPNATRNPFAAVLLAGGRSTRMGCDKAGLLIDGLALWQRQLQTLRSLAPDELVISGRADGPYAEAGVPVISDDTADLGPLGGLATILRRIKCDRLLVLAIDLPTMTPGFLSRMVYGPGIVPRLDHRFEPLAAVFPLATLPLIERRLATGELSMQHFVREAIAAGLVVEYVVSDSERSLFRNLNRPTDL